MGDVIKILLVEDDQSVRESLKENLSIEGYEVLTADDGLSGLVLFEEAFPDLVILDVMMPGLDGLEVCRKIREFKRGTPVIMLTAKCGEVDKVVGLEVGADDYLTKPFAIRELQARIRALLRRVNELSFSTQGKSLNEQIEVETLDLGHVQVDFRTYQAFRSGEEIGMSAKEFELLKFLAMHSDKPVSRDQLLDQVWGYDHYPTTRTVDNFIARLRNKIEEVPAKPRHILTVHGVGYKFVL